MRVITGLFQSNSGRWRGEVSIHGQAELQLQVKIREAADSEKGVRIDIDNSGPPRTFLQDEYVILNEEDLSEKSITIAHEFGHVLGFDDHYYWYIDDADCSIDYV